MHASAARAIVLATLAGIVGFAMVARLAAPGEGFERSPTLPMAMVDVVVEGGRRLSVGRYEVSWQDWKRCHDDGACTYLPPPGRRDTDRPIPVTGVNRFDVVQFIAWENVGAARIYRLPTAREWREFAAALPHPERKKLFEDPRLAWAADYGAMASLTGRVEPSGHFGALGNGIHDLAGNVWEWTATCARPGDDATCPAFLTEGLHEAAVSIFIRDPAAGGCATGTPPTHIGFRLVADVEPAHASRRPAVARHFATR